MYFDNRSQKMYIRHLSDILFHFGQVHMYVFFL